MAGMSAFARTGYEVRVGIVGPRELVERAMLSGLPGSATAQLQPSESEPGLQRRLVMAPYVQEHDAPEKVARLGGSVSAILFASRVPLDYSRRSGVLDCPATTAATVSPGGAADVASSVRRPLRASDLVTTGMARPAIQRVSS